MKKIEECLVCGHKEQKLFLRLNDYMVTGEEFNIVECVHCGFHFTNPIPNQEDIGRFYKSEEYISHSSSKKGIINSLYNVVRNKTLKDKVKWVRNEVSGNRLLDVGSGTGHFLKVANDNGFEGYGLEPDEAARAYAHKKNHIRSCDQSELYDLERNSVDVITMWHVLEHVYDLKKDVSYFYNTLDAGGKLFVAVPNMNSYDARFYKKHWAAYDVPRHLYHFQKQDIGKFFMDNGFELEKVIPMKYDAYYVSMLSEKYRKRPFFFGALIGFISNRRAKKFGYSSQVYILSKK
jgi:2-polyprenyl-3-methyl-5-hydroxy-6-metoxy-1,4-benzoquinol methylase